MGLLTLLDSRTHRNARLWKPFLRFTFAVRRVWTLVLER
jgi:hypothetical protein